MPLCSPERAPGTCPAGAGAAGETAEEGSAVVEFIFLAVLLVIPVVYLILTLAGLQAGAFAAAGAADQAAKVYAAAASPAAGEELAGQAVRLALADAGFDGGAGSVAISCGGTGCQSPGATITARVTIRVPLPLVPSLPGVNTDAASVHAESSAVIGRYR
jgi:hypothetical protein